MNEKINHLRRECLKFAHGSGASMSRTDRYNIETIGAAMRFRPEAPIKQRQRWELAFLALKKIAIAQGILDDGGRIDLSTLLSEAKAILESHCGPCSRGELCRV